MSPKIDTYCPEYSLNNTLPPGGLSYVDLEDGICQSVYLEALLSAEISEWEWDLAGSSSRKLFREGNLPEMKWSKEYSSFDCHVNLHLQILRTISPRGKINVSLS